MSPPGEFEPSLVRKSGSSPPVASKRACARAGVTLHPADGSWQVTQARPLVPRLWKNRPVVSILPSVEKVRDTPAELGNPARFGRAIWLCAREAGVSPRPTPAASALLARTRILRGPGRLIGDPPHCRLHRKPITERK